MDTEEQPTQTTRQEYLRDYMRQRYHKDKTISRAYKNTLRLKKANSSISCEDQQKFGIYLANVIKIRKLKATIPPDMIQDI